uniref:Insulin like growth factor binding protein 7 n=1 Tax=Phasianus colchicus TaxID=9054 RepID=A0A669PYX2_PHACC
MQIVSSLFLAEQTSPACTGASPRVNEHSAWALYISPFPGQRELFILQTMMRATGKCLECLWRAADVYQQTMVSCQPKERLCIQGPSIVTPPKDIWNVTGAQIYLSCEVIGIPTPVLIWNKIIQGQYGIQRMELLPGDRENLAIQTRGGPEKHEVTGWVLISPLSKEDAGEYECHASNAKGEATASAKIHVVETLHEIALTKGNKHTFKEHTADE